MSFTGKVVMVTGGGSGIGLAVAEVFAREGASVCITGRRQAKLDEAVKRLREIGKADFYGIPMNVADPASVAEAFKALDAKSGRLDVLVNNAGIREIKSIVDLTPEEWRAVIDTNLNGPFYCSREAVPRMRNNPDGQGGAIVNTASVGGLIGIAARPAYCASKHGVVGLTRTLAKDLAPYRIRVNAVAPGLIKTDLTGAYYQDPAFLTGLEQMVPLGNSGGAADVARAFLFLASPQASFITGVVLPVDGGWVCEKNFTFGGSTVFTSPAAASTLI